ncbi:ATP-binding protein [Ramlibacter sp. MAHUQ-53]|uniref:ATP-binding protein n=1 Tax=unclassified Ramlibacter TaxID=2617605 RepID=UPI00362A59AE
MSPGRSIHREVLWWVLGALGLGAGILIAATWWVLAEEMEEVFEDNLKQVALAVVHHHGAAPGAAPRLAQELPRVYEEFGSFEFVTAVWSREGALLASSHRDVRLPFHSRSGLTQVRASGESWHLYTIVLEDGIVQAAQRASEREILARETAGALVLPAAGVLALIAGLVTLALRRGLEPLARAADEVAARSAESLHPIALSSQPPELHHLVGAVNDLMARLGHALAQQRHFMADAAHELRTPMTALRLQAQLLERAQEPAQRAMALDELREGIERTQRLVERLLQLARVSPDAPPTPEEAVDLSALVRDCVSRFAARAEHAGIDLGATNQAAPVVAGDPQQLAMLLDNLVENALRHVPRGGRIDVAAAREGAAPCLLVNDTGPGIAAEERGRVFDRFYRGPQASGYGSGLGLSIVRAVAVRHGARVELGDAPGGGLQVRVLFPAG